MKEEADRLEQIMREELKKQRRLYEAALKREREIVEESRKEFWYAIGGATVSLGLIAGSFFFPPLLFAGLGVFLLTALKLLTNTRVDAKKIETVGQLQSKAINHPVTLSISKAELKGHAISRSWHKDATEYSQDPSVGQALADYKRSLTIEGELTGDNTVSKVADLFLDDSLTKKEQAKQKERYISSFTGGRFEELPLMMHFMFNKSVGQSFEASLPIILLNAGDEFDAACSPSIREIDGEKVECSLLNNSSEMELSRIDGNPPAYQRKGTLTYYQFQETAQPTNIYVLNAQTRQIEVRHVADEMISVTIEEYEMLKQSNSIQKDVVYTLPLLSAQITAQYTERDGSIQGTLSDCSFTLFSPSHFKVNFAALTGDDERWTKYAYQMPEKVSGEDYSKATIHLQRTEESSVQQAAAISVEHEDDITRGPEIIEKPTIDVKGKFKPKQD